MNYAIIFFRKNVIFIKKTLLFIIILLFSINIKALDLENNKINVAFNKCIDGDTATFKYDDEIIKVRFLAIDAPELEHEEQVEEPFAKESLNYTCSELKKAKIITLEFDNNADRQDKYERYLAWVFVDNELLQEKIVKKGYAKVAYLYGDYKYTSKLKRAQRNAKRNKRGIWYNSKNYDYLYFLIPFIILLFLLLMHRKMS